MRRGPLFWITGRPASGKSTFGLHLQHALWHADAPCLLLDGDAVRRVLTPRPSFAPRARAAFYRSLADLALLAANQGLWVVIAATGHRRSFRLYARQRAVRFCEIFVDVPEEICRRRDPKGLYRLANKNGAPELPGHGVRYQPPAAPEVTARGGRDRVALQEVLAWAGVF